MGILLWLVFGAIVGWIAGIIMGDQKSLVMNIIVGIVGSFLGSWLASTFFDKTFTDFSIEGLIFSVIGAALLIFIKRLITGKGF